VEGSEVFVQLTQLNLPVKPDQAQRTTFDTDLFADLCQTESILLKLNVIHELPNVQHRLIPQRGRRIGGVILVYAVAEFFIAKSAKTRFQTGSQI
jgi:hypothetical protein